MKSAIRLIIITQALILAGIAPAQAGSIKKWVDENGVTHYGTSVPPQYVDRAHSELNNRGIEVRRYDRALTEEELEREKALRVLRAEQQRLRDEQQERDRILLSLYRNEDDLVMARDGKLAQLDGQIRLNYAEIRRLKSRLSELQALAAEAERTGKPLAPQRKANLESTQRSIEKSYATILGKEDEKRATIERYEHDLARFRVLHQGAARAVNADKIVKSEYPDLVDTAVRCEDAAECDRIWQIAQEYARKNATTPVDLSGERILVTAPPRALRDISITVSRLQDDKRGGERIFMDVQCASFTEGKEFCRSPEVAAIRENFRQAIGEEPSTRTP